MEYLLTEHHYRWEIAQLSNGEIERLRGMLEEAVERCIRPDEIYAAITRGFDASLGISASSPPLVYDLSEETANNEKELMAALLREISTV